MYTTADDQTEIYVGISTLPLSVVPILDLHGTAVVELFVHLECVPQHVRLMTPSLLQTFVFGSVEVVLQDGLVVGMSALLDDDAGTLTWRETTDIGQALR